MDLISGMDNEEADSWLENPGSILTARTFSVLFINILEKANSPVHGAWFSMVSFLGQAALFTCSKDIGSEVWWLIKSGTLFS